MPTKRPDQLPEGEDFDFEDILMIEKNPNSGSRQLLKAEMRDFMISALKTDPQRMGSNAILGLQSKFDWLIAQMDKITESSILNIDNYDDFESPSKNEEGNYITPTPTPTTTPSITPSSTPLDPNQPKPSPTPTPTPTQTPKPLTKELQLEIQGSKGQILNLPFEYLPSTHGYSDWRIKNGTETDNIYIIYNGYFPSEFIPSGAGERLSTLNKISKNRLSIETVIIGPTEDFLETEGLVRSTQGLIDGSTLRLSIILF
jgi:hypothetical protein